MSGLKEVCVAGAGYLGTQIGILCARHGYKVRMYDISRDALDSSRRDMENYVESWVREGEISPKEGERVKSRVFFEGKLEAAERADLVIEAVVERLDVKREVFRKLDYICPPQTLLASNSSSIRISKIEDAVYYPERLLNMHFYSFPWRTRIVEIMKGTKTTDEVVQKAIDFSRSIHVTPLIVRKESTGFIFNRIWRAIKKEALTVVDEGVASHEDVDRAWMSLYGTAAGPFGLMDRVGLDVVRDIEVIYYEESGDPRDAPPQILLEKIERGELGVKTGKGFYSYPDPTYADPYWLKGPA